MVAPSAAASGRLRSTGAGTTPAERIERRRMDGGEFADQRIAYHQAWDRDTRVGRVIYACRMRISRLLKGRVAKEEAVLIGDPRVEGWESVSTFEDQRTAVAWRDQLRSTGVDASCVADHPLDRFGRGDIYLMVPPEQWSRASEIVDNLE